MGKKKLISDHLVGKDEWIITLFEKLRTDILDLKDVEEKVRDPYIGYYFNVQKKRARLFVEVHIQNKKIELHLRKLEYKNYSEMSIKDAPDTNKWTLTKLVNIDSKADLRVVMSLIEQSYGDVY